MSKLSIKTYGNRVLESKSRKVHTVDKEVKIFVKDMAEIMYEGRGVGLAAPQVGVLKRIIVFDPGNGLMCLINPEITWTRGREVMPEGCLSFPGVELEVKRHREIAVRALDLDGKSVEFKARDITARIIQHEVDHLDGVLIVDRVSRKKLKPIKEKLEELKKLSDKS